MHFVRWDGGLSRKIFGLQMVSFPLNSNLARVWPGTANHDSCSASRFKRIASVQQFRSHVALRANQVLHGLPPFPPFRTTCLPHHSIKFRCFSYCYYPWPLYCCAGCFVLILVSLLSLLCCCCCASCAALIVVSVCYWYCYDSCIVAILAWSLCCSIYTMSVTMNVYVTNHVFEICAVLNSEAYHLSLLQPTTNMYVVVLKVYSDQAARRWCILPCRCGLWFLQFWHVSSSIPS